jgi:hypothetical protein
MNLSTPTAGATTATWDGETYAIGNDAGRFALTKALRTATADQLTEPVVLNDVVVYRDGWNRNGLGFTPEALRSVATTATGKAHLFDHNSQLRMGCVLSSRLVEDESGCAIVQSLEVSTDFGLRTLALGIRPEYSIQWQSSPETVVLCSSHAAPLVDCSCWPGDRLSDDDDDDGDGGVVMALWTHATHGETSQTFLPAVPGTGQGQLHSSPYLLQLTQQRIARRGSPMKIDDGIEPTTQAEPITAALSEMQAELAVSNEKVTLLTARLERVECERVETESRKMVRALRVEGRLVGDERAMLEARAQNPGLFDTVLSFVKPNSAHQFGQVTGAANGAPEAPVSQNDFYSLRARIEARLTDDPTLDADRVWAEERNEMEGN